MKYKTGLSITIGSIISAHLLAYDPCRSVFYWSEYLLQHEVLVQPLEQEAENIEMTVVNGVAIQTIHFPHISIIAPITGNIEHQLQETTAGMAVIPEQYPHVYTAIVTTLSVISLFAILWFARR